MLKSKLLRAVTCASAVVLMAGHQAQAAECGTNGSGFSGFIKAFHHQMTFVRFHPYELTGRLEGRNPISGG